MTFAPFYATLTKMVYFIQAEKLGLIKIGQTRQKGVIKRLQELQRVSPDKLKVLSTLLDPDWKEKELHKKFAHLWEHGEWFHPGEDLLNFINNLPPKVVTPQKEVELVEQTQGDLTKCSHRDSKQLSLFRRERRLYSSQKVKKGPKKYKLLAKDIPQISDYHKKLIVSLTSETK